MKEDYLWDKSGEADDEIERLENMLGSLRYKRPAEPLPLPAVSRSWFRLNSTLLAAAAAIVLLLLAGGLWLKLNRASSDDNLLSSGPPPPTGPVNTTGGMFAMIKNVRLPEPASAPHPRNTVTPLAPVNRSQFVAAKFNAARRTRELQEQYLRRGEIAKEQLIKAMQITSDKLSVVQKKIQGTHEGGPIS